MLRKLMMLATTVSLLFGLTGCTMTLGQFGIVPLGTVTADPANGVMYNAQPLGQVVDRVLEQLSGPAVQVVRGHGRSQNEEYVQPGLPIYFEDYTERSITLVLKTNMILGEPARLVPLSSNRERVRVFTEPSWSAPIINHRNGATYHYEVRVRSQNSDQMLVLPITVVSSGPRNFQR